MELLNTNPTQVASDISNLGMMAVTAAFFLILSASLWIIIFKWFKSIIGNMLTNYSKNIDILLEETRKQNSKLDTIKEGLISETLQRTKTISNALFDLYGWHAMEILNRVRKENHIINKEATLEKVHNLLTVEYGEVNTKLDNFTYKGKKLSKVTNSKWIDWLSEAVDSELYNENGPSPDRAITNINLVVDKIKLDFYHRLIG